MATVVGERPWVGRIFVDGEFREPEGGRWSPITDKATGEELAQAGLASEADVERAVRSAQAAQPGSTSQRNAERRGLRVAYTRAVLVRDPV